MKMQKLNDRDAAIRKTYLLKDRVFRDISVEGFETCSLQRYAVKLALLKHFASCGKILPVPVLKSVAFIRFDGEGAQEKALELDGTDVGGWTAIEKEKMKKKKMMMKEKEKKYKYKGSLLGEDEPS